MAITKAEFKNAFRKVASLEFSHIPTDENSIQYTFSEKFNRRMEKLIKSQKKVYWNFVNTASKRVAIIILAIFTMFTAAFSVKAIREPIVKFITEIYETFTHYFFDGDTTDIITQEYSIKVLPDGFNQTNQVKSDVFVTTEYQDDSGNIIQFTQMTTEHSVGYFFDNENGTITTEYVGDVEVQFYEAYDLKQAMWTKGEYVLNVTCYGNVTFDTIKQVVQSVK